MDDDAVNSTEQTPRSAILALETTTDACSVALLSAQGDVQERHVVAPRQHSSLLLPMIEELVGSNGLRMSDLAGVVVGTGPGSFMGVRLGISVVQGLALGADLPVVGVSSLLVVATGAHRETGARIVHVAMDARMGEVYSACYDFSRRGSDRSPDGPLAPVALVDDCVVAPTSVPIPMDPDWRRDAVAVGPGWEVYNCELQARLDWMPERVETQRLPRARDCLSLVNPASFSSGANDDLVAIRPRYLRDNVATPKTRPP